MGRFFINILYFIVLFMLLMSLCRLAFILESGVIGGNIGETWTLNDIFTTMFNGIRYDGRIVSFLSLIYGLLYILTSSLKKRPLILTAFSMFLSFVTVFLYACDTVYFNIYGDTFNTIILGLIYDDRQAIFQTGAAGDYNILLRIFLTILSTGLFSYIFYVGFKKLSRFKFKKAASVLIFSVMVCYITALLMASTLNLKGGSLDYLITPAKNPFLMKAAPGALRDIYVVYLNYKDILSCDFDSFSNGLSPKEAANVYFQKDILTGEADLSFLMKRTVETGSNSRIKHIFVIIGESLSEWHFDKEFKEVGITSGLSEIALSDKGKKLPVFIQSGSGTIGTLDVMLTGLYSADFPISSMVGVLESFLSSNAVFKTLGYSNYFYYFGSPSWRKLDRYVLSQGFDKLYSVSDMGTQKRGVWGIYDNDGFDFVLEKALEHADEFTFNMILTTSYHPPYDVPVKDYGAPVDEIKLFLDKKYPENIRSKEMNPNIMAHLWLMDKSVSKFVKEISEKLPDSLIVITGDHFDRIHPNPVRSLKVKNGVPLILYGKNVSDAVFKYAAGSHTDIMPTIVELTAPKGFTYHSFGLPLLSLNENTVTDVERIALGYDCVASGRFIASDDGSVEYFGNHTKQESDINLINDAIFRQSMGKALSLYILEKGYPLDLSGAE